MRRRRNADKLGPLFRWAKATTCDLPVEDRLAAVERLFDDNLIGRHALSHLEWDEHFRVPTRTPTGGGCTRAAGARLRPMRARCGWWRSTARGRPPRRAQPAHEGAADGRRRRPAARRPSRRRRLRRRWRSARSAARRRARPTASAELALLGQVLASWRSVSLNHPVTSTVPDRGAQGGQSDAAVSFLAAVLLGAVVAVVLGCLRAGARPGRPGAVHPRVQRHAEHEGVAHHHRPRGGGRAGVPGRVAVRQDRRRRTEWVGPTHRLVGTLTFLGLPVAYHCLWALGFEDDPDQARRLCTHSWGARSTGRSP